jgi:hypothetical protein
MEFLLEEALAAGCDDRQAVVTRAAEGISFRTLERAKAALGAESQQRREAGRNVGTAACGIGEPASRRAEPEMSKP